MKTCLWILCVFYSLLIPQYLNQCLEQGKCSTDVCQMLDDIWDDSQLNFSYTIWLCLIQGHHSSCHFPVYCTRYLFLPVFTVWKSWSAYSGLQSSTGFYFLASLLPTPCDLGGVTKHGAPAIKPWRGEAWAGPGQSCDWWALWLSWPVSWEFLLLLLLLLLLYYYYCYIIIINKMDGILSYVSQGSKV